MECSISDLVWDSLDRSSFGQSFQNKSFTDKKSTPKSHLSQTPKNQQSQSLSLKTTSRRHDSEKNLYLNTPESNKEDSNIEEIPPEIARKPLKHSVVKRIQHDLRSLSASARLRALKALRSPTKSSYENFDVPHEEQELITDEEKKLQANAASSIQEVLKDVVIYVEVRTGVDNRSAGIKKVISSLGAKVNDRFLRDTTHVVFKDGLQSTYNKAKKWNIPIVSILWIEECKKHMKLMDPKKFSISNAKIYENPELYSKKKRLKSLQPNAEDQRRRRLKNKPEEYKRNDWTTMSPALRFPRKPRDKLREIFNEFQEKLKNTTEKDDPSQDEIKILQRIRDSPYLSQKKNKTKKTSIDGACRTLNFSRSSSICSIDYDFETTCKNTSHNTKNKADFIDVTAGTLSSSQKEKNNCENSRPHFTEMEKNTSQNLANSSQIEDPIANENEDISDENFKAKSTKKCNMSGADQKIREKRATKRKTSLTQYSIEISARATGKIRIGNHAVRKTVYSPQSMEETKLTPNEKNSTALINEPLKRSKSKSKIFTTAGVMSNLESTDIICDKATISAEININSDKPELQMTKSKRTLLDMSMDISENHLENVKRPKKPNGDNASNNSVVRSRSIKKTDVDNINKEDKNKAVDIHLRETKNKCPNVKNKKKRKLFAHTELNSTPPPQPPALPKPPETKKQIHKSGLKVSNKMRRSLIDFEKRRKIKNSCTPSQKQTTLLSFMVFTNMYSKHINFIKEAISKLGGFQLEDNVSDRTTHVLTLEPRRTINLLKGIIRGLWILNYKWIEDSYASGKWLYEEDYEVRDFSRAVQVCRSERQAFGRNYRLELFEDIPPIFISPKCSVPKASLKELILLCGGKVTEAKEDAKYIVGEYCDSITNKIFVQPQWILDSITNIQIKKVSKYIISPE